MEKWSTMDYALLPLFELICKQFKTYEQDKRSIRNIFPRKTGQNWKKNIFVT